MRLGSSQTIETSILSDWLKPILASATISQSFYDTISIGSISN